MRRFHDYKNKLLWNPCKRFISLSVLCCPELVPNAILWPANLTHACVHSEDQLFVCFRTEWIRIVVTVCLSILVQMEFHSVQNRKGNCHHDHIPFNMKGNGILAFSVKALKHPTTVMVPRVFRRAPIAPRETSLSDSRCEVSQSGYHTNDASE